MLIWDSKWWLGRSVDGIFYDTLDGIGEPLCHIGLVYWRKFFMAKSNSTICPKKIMRSDPNVPKKAIELAGSVPKVVQLD